MTIDFANTEHLAAEVIKLIIREDYVVKIGDDFVRLKSVRETASGYEVYGNRFHLNGTAHPNPRYRAPLSEIASMIL